MSARSELDSVRSVVAQLDVSRGPEKAKADLMAVWSAVEAALRSLVGGSTASGQTLVRDARSRQLLTFDQANALVAFDSVREQLARPDYVPSEADANAARSAFLKLDAGLVPAGGPTYSATAPTAPSPTPASAPVVSEAVVVTRKRRPLWIPIVAVLGIAVLVAVAFMLRPKSGNTALAEGITAYTSNDRATAAMKFQQAARAEPNSALPHVYLSRMAREVGNYTVANEELQTALKVEPQSLEARREYGSLFLAQGNYDMARTFYVRALEVNGNDKPSAGWLSCALIRLNRVQEAQVWITRAGPGPWSSCVNTSTPGAPGVSPP